MDTKDLAYMTLIKPFFVVFELQNGLSEREFTDEDFKDVVTECPKGFKNKSLPLEMLDPFGMF